jgi:hypothetical protein
MASCWTFSKHPPCSHILHVIISWRSKWPHSRWHLVEQFQNIFRLPHFAYMSTNIFHTNTLN